MKPNMYARKTCTNPQCSLSEGIIYSITKEEARTHSDIGFQLTPFPGRRKVMEPKGEKSKELKVFEQLFLASCKTKCSQNARLSCNNAVERVCGRYREQTTMETKNSGRGKPVESMC